MEKAFVIADNFRLIHNGHLKLLKQINKLLIPEGVSKIFILISEEPGDMLRFMDKESILKKLIHSEQFKIEEVDTLKLSQKLKELEKEGCEIVKVFCEPFNRSYIDSNISGLNIPVIEYKHGINCDDLENSIKNNEYQKYCEMAPNKIHDEFQNLKEIYNMNKNGRKESPAEVLENKNINKTNKLKEKKMKVTREMLEKIVRDQLTKRINENATKKVVTLKKKDLIAIINEVLDNNTEAEMLNKVDDLEKEIGSKLTKLVKSKWVRKVIRIKKTASEFQFEIIGDGKKKIIVKWVDNPPKNNLFQLTTEEALIAGDEYSMKTHEYMMLMIKEREQVYKMLKEVQFSLENVGTGLEEVEAEKMKNEKPAPTTTTNKTEKPANTHKLPKPEAKPASTAMPKPEGIKPVTK